MVRNVWNPFDKNHEKILGCTTVNRLYITPIGDVLVCPYVHIKIGNIFEKSLKEIVDYGFSIKYFKNHSDLCLAGEDKDGGPLASSMLIPIVLSFCKSIFIKEKNHPKGCGVHYRKRQIYSRLPLCI